MQIPMYRFGRSNLLSLVDRYCQLPCYARSYLFLPDVSVFRVSICARFQQSETISSEILSVVAKRAGEEAFSSYETRPKLSCNYNHMRVRCDMFTAPAWMNSICL